MDIKIIEPFSNNPSGVLTPPMKKHSSDKKTSPRGNSARKNEIVKARTPVVAQSRQSKADMPSKDQRFQD